MSKGKIAVITLIFTIVTFVIPFLLLLIFVPADNISIYVTAFGILFFASLGFVTALVLSVKKDVLNAVDEIKVQNAAIAFRLSQAAKSEQSGDPAVRETAPAVADEQISQIEPASADAEEKFDDFQ